MAKKPWTDAEIRAWVDSQGSWYQSIRIRDGLVTPGSTEATKRLELLALPDDLSGRTVLDLGCNSGLLCFECKRRGADRVVGIDLSAVRIGQAQTLADILDLDIEFQEMDLFDAPRLGEFDTVFCCAILHHVSDLIGALNVLKQVTRRALYLELPLLGDKRHDRLLLRLVRWIGVLSRWTPKRLLRRLRRHRDDGRKRIVWDRLGMAVLRRMEKNGRVTLSLMPDLGFLMGVLGEEFQAEELGPSSRFGLLKLTRSGSGAERALPSFP